jgi:hypothetical protein
MPRGLQCREEVIMVVKRTYYFAGDRTFSVTFQDGKWPDVTEKIHYYTDVLGIQQAINDRWLYYKDEELDELCAGSSGLPDPGQ